MLSSRLLSLSLLSLSTVGFASLVHTWDTCAKIDCHLEFDYHNYGRIDICLCLSGVDAFIGSNDVARNAANVVGAPRVHSELYDRIHNSDHQTSYCSQPSYRKRSPAEIARLEHKCEFGLTKCGIYTDAPSHSSSSSTPTSTDLDSYECLDTMTNLESCGGCMEPYTLGLTSVEISELKPGVDCTAIRGVSDVQCRRGQCVVNKCKKGYKLVPIIDGDVVDGLFECVRIGGGGTGTGEGEGELHNQIGGIIQWKRRQQQQH